MGTPLKQIDDAFAAFIQRQPMFFVGTAPLAADGHINLSPKGLDSFRILDPTTVGYLDLTGSGIETAAHLKENGRIVIMFCAFEGAPKILRIHGRGDYVDAASAEFGALMTQFSPLEGVRGIVRIKVTRVADSCGWGVPLMRYEGERTKLVEWCRDKGEAGLADYRAKKNKKSIDGLEGLK